MIKELRNAAPVVVVMSVMLLFGVGFSIFKIVTAFSSQETSPAYQRSPSQAFALPEADTIVEPVNLTEPRLPDDAYVFVYTTVDQLSAEVADGGLAETDLTAAGMSSFSARQTLIGVAGLHGFYAGHPAADTDHAVTLDDISGADAAAASSTITYLPNSQGVPGGDATLNFGFAGSGSQWRLESMSATY